ncbi:ATP-binding protein [Kitasatospora purpeofusca]|uniref:ATP-binding protein n=1 Tax=Kitasatospora purpeofusca TaxID=67352 RepID=UPI0035DF5A1B
MTAAAEKALVRPGGADRVEALLPYEPQSAGAARRLVFSALRGWELGDLVEAAELVVSELVGNAVKTGCRREMTVTVARITHRSVRISVRDGSRILPCLIDAGTAAESGRGMALVHYLTGGHWGATLEPYGKTVHADLRTRFPGSAEPQKVGAWACRGEGPPPGPGLPLSVPSPIRPAPATTVISPTGCSSASTAAPSLSPPGSLP